MAAAGYVKLKQVDRSLLVELAADRADLQEVEKQAAPAAPAMPAAAVPANGHAEQPQGTVAPTPAQMEEGVRAMQEVFQNAKITPHWPMYLRNVKQFIKNASPSFDERRYGFQSFLEAVRSGQRAGLFRLERNRQGVLRVCPGNQMAQPQAVAPPAVDVVEEPPAVEQPMTIEEQPSVGEFQAEPASVIDVQPEPAPETTQPE